MSNGQDEADWSGVKMSPAKIGGNRWFEYNHYLYCSPGECVLAILLDELGVPFTPDLAFMLKNDGHCESNRELLTFVPDFILNQQAWVWTSSYGLETIIHGFECKASPRVIQRALLLYRQRRINILVLGDSEIIRYHELGCLPIRPL